MDEEKVGPDEKLGIFITLRRVRELLDQPGYTHELLVNAPGFRKLYVGIEDEYFDGAIDCHAHVSPDYVERSDDICTYAVRAAQLGMRAIVMKNHYHLTAHAAAVAQRYVDLLVERGDLRNRIKIYGDVCLNFGFIPEHVELAVRYPFLKVVRMPTFNTVANHLAEGKPGGMTILDSRGEIIPEVKRIVEIAVKNNKSICSGHLGTGEALALAALVKELGGRVVINHPLTDNIMGIPIANLVEAADLGAYIGLTAMHFLPSFYKPVLDPRVTMEAIEAIWPERCLLYSDVGQIMNWPPLDGLKMMVRGLIGYGVEPEAIKMMLQTNVAKYLYMDEESE